MNPSKRLGDAVLLAGHCAGMLDLVALPIWMGVLIGGFHFEPQRAGGLVTLFLAGQVVSSVICSMRLRQCPTQLLAATGFFVCAAAFAISVALPDYGVLALCHLVGGLAAGTALSMTHGTIGCSENPHRLFASAQLAIAVFGIFVLGAGPKLIAVAGPSALFWMFAGLVAIAAVAAALAFPHRVGGAAPAGPTAPKTGLPSVVWFAIAGISTLSLAQAMIVSFMERIGVDRGYGASAVAGVLIAVGVLNLLPGPLAALLQGRLRAERVVLVGPLVHAGLTLLLTRTDGFLFYAAACVMFIATLVFTHTFLFGLLARLDPTGRAVAATPAMLMIGSSTGPLLAGTLVEHHGYPTLGLAVASIGLVSFALFTRLQRLPSPAALPSPAEAA